MGTDTIGIVTKATKVNFLELADTLNEAIIPFSTSCAANIQINPVLQGLEVGFQVMDTRNPENRLGRCLRVYFKCQEDHPEYGKTHISLSIGCWGDSVEIMTAVTAAVARLVGNNSKAYVLPDDSQDTEFTEIPVAMAA